MMHTNNYFSLLGIAKSFDIDLKQLAKAYRQLQIQYHPDRFAAESDTVKRQSVQKAALINDAYSTLSHVILRAKYLLTLESGLESIDNNLVSEPMFLLKQIDAREKLEQFTENNGSYDDLMSLIDDYQLELDNLATEFKLVLTEKKWDDASVVIAKMQLFSKLLDEANALEESID